MSFQVAFKKIADAVDTHPVEGIADLSIRDGMMWADDGRLCAVVPFEWEGADFSAKAAPIAKAFKVFGEKAKLVDKEDAVQVRAGRRSVTVTKSESLRKFRQAEGEKIALTDEFVDALRRVAPFMSDDKTKPYVCTLLVQDEHIYACNNIILAATSVASAEMDVTIPDICVEYLLKRREAPTHYSLTDRSLCFYYSDGSFIISIRLTQEMPEQVVRLAQTAFDVECTPLTVEWIAHVKAIMELSDDALHICEDKIYSKSEFGNARALIEVETPIEGETVWNPKFLRLVMAKATEIDFTAYPNPCAWAGNNCVGLIVGRK